MILKNTPQYFAKLGFTESSFTDKNCSKDTWDTLFFKDYTKKLMDDDTRIQVCFGYEVLQDQTKKHTETSVCFYNSDCDIETTIKTTVELEDFLNHTELIARYFK